MQRSHCANINNFALRCSALKPVVPPPVPRSPSDSSALPAASCGVAQAALFPPGGGSGVAQAALFPTGGGVVAAQAALFPPGGGGGDGPSHILNGRLALHAGLPVLPTPSAATAAAGVANCDIALQYQRLFEEQRDLSPLTQQLNNHCATSAATAAPAVAPPTAKCPPSSPDQQQRRLSAPNNGPQAVGGNRRAATLASRRRSSAAVQRKTGRSPESSPLSTYPPPPSDYGLPVTQSSTSSFPVPVCSPSPESLAHRCRPELYLRNGETYIGPDYSTTTLPHRVSVFCAPRSMFAGNPIFFLRFRKINK
jgi:hypothetical protein